MAPCSRCRQPSIPQSDRKTVGAVSARPWEKKAGSAGAPPSVKMVNGDRGRKGPAAEGRQVPVGGRLLSEPEHAVGFAPTQGRWEVERANVYGKPAYGMVRGRASLVRPIAIPDMAVALCRRREPPGRVLATKHPPQHPDDTIKVATDLTARSCSFAGPLSLPTLDHVRPLAEQSKSRYNIW